MKMLRLLVCLLGVVSALSASAEDGKKLNVVLIMADDAGAECFNCYGGTSYKTPNIDAIAQRGALFTAAHSQPICTPTRVKLMTGMSNGRNYIRFGMLDAQAYTFGNLMKEAGYATGLIGKWQLWGRADESFAHEGMHPTQAGFDEYLCWHLDKRLSRYWKPTLEHNGEFLETDKDDFGPTILADYAVDFIKRHKDEPFFLYYPMVLPHDPFVTTPHSEDRNHKGKQQNFADMIAYTDHVVGRIDAALQAHGLSENTLLIFTADNGTGRAIKSMVGDVQINGAKGHPIDYGTHVPMVAVCDGLIQPGTVCDDLIDFTDFFATLTDLSGAKPPAELTLDGRSFLPQLRGENGNPREYLYCYYNARPTNPNWWGLGVQRFVRDHRYKLYATGKFYDVIADPLEQSPIAQADMTGAARQIRDRFQQVLASSPASPPRLAQPKK